MALKLENISILIVEDVVPMRGVLVKIMEMLGIGKIYTAKDGRQAFDIFCRANPDIVLTDWHMPISDGLEFVQNIRTSAKSPNKLAPVIFVTGYGAPERIAQARDLGVTEYIVKPFTAADLAKRIAHVINAPRDFVESSAFIGPDRRRQRQDPKGDKKRVTDRET